MSLAEEREAARWLAWTHPVLVAVVVAIGAAMGAGLFIVAAFGGVVSLLAIPLILLCLVLALAWLARGLLGRSQWLANTVLVLICAAIALTLYSHGIPGVGFAGAAVTPMVVGVAGGVMSLALHPRPTRFLGLAGVVAAMVVVGAPIAGAVITRQEAAAAADEDELRRVMDSSVRPYTVPGLVVRSSQFSSQDSWLTLSRDPDATPDDDFVADPGDVTILTSVLWTPEDLEQQACGLALDPELGGSRTNTCEPLGTATWAIEKDGTAEVVRMIGDRRVTISGMSASELSSMAATILLLDHRTFEEQFRAHQERNRTI
jgi:hypothetical protein